MAEHLKVTVHRSMNSLPDDQVPLDVLEVRFKAMKEFNFWNLEMDCRRFADMITIWREKELYKHFYDSWQEFLDDYIEKPQEWVDHVVEGVALLDNSKPISTQEALQAAITKTPEANPPEYNGCQKVTPEVMSTISELRKQGLSQQAIANKVGLSQKTVSNTLSSDDYNIMNTTKMGALSSPSRQGTSQEYLISRLKRDYPESLDEIGEGKKFKSVRQAAIATGIIKPKITVQFDPNDSGGEIISKLYQKLSDDQLKEMLENLLNYFGG